MADDPAGACRVLLQRAWLFAGLAPDELAQVIEVATRRLAKPGEVIVRQGDEGTSLQVLLSGRLRVSSTSPAGDDVVLSILDAGDVFGEVALFDGGVRSATVTAMRRSDLLVVERDALLALLRRLPDAAPKLLAVMARRIRALSQRAEDQAALDVKARLAKEILALGRRFGRPVPDGRVHIDLQISQRDLGSLVGAGREMANKCLAALAEAGLISVHDQLIVIEREEELRDAAEVGRSRGRTPRSSRET